MTLREYIERRNKFPSLYLPAPGSNRTVLVTSHIWWTELMAYALHRLGYNVLVTGPWYGFFLSDAVWADFDTAYDFWVKSIREKKVDLIVGGNSTAMVPHPRTGEMLHETAGVPLVNYWWDEPRMAQPMNRRGFSLSQYWQCLANPKSLNVIWEEDVMEELARFFGLTNTACVPVGTTPEFWPVEHIPMEQRPMKACFIGNLHHAAADQPQGLDRGLERWSRAVLAGRCNDLNRSFADLAADADARVPAALRTKSPAEGWTEEDLRREFERWSCLGSAQTLLTRNPYVTALAERLGPDFGLIGEGWDRLGLTAAHTKIGAPKCGRIYARARLSLNLPGPCMHSGVTLRAFDIASCNGLLFTPYSRELPAHFEPGTECVAFGNESQMLEMLEHVLAAPGEFTKVAEAGRARAARDHSWENRMSRVMRAARERFDLPWTSDDAAAAA